MGIGGNFLEEEHTLKNFRDEQWNWDLFSRQNYISWQKEDKKDILCRAKEKLEKIISENYPPGPVLEDSVAGTLDEIEKEAISNL